MMTGLLSGLGDPVFMAKLAARRRIEERVAERMDITLREARQLLYAFEDDLCSCGQTFH